MDNLKIINKLRDDYWLNFARAVLDLILCLNDIGLQFTMLGMKLSPGFEEAFVMGAELIYLYGLKRVMRN